MSLMESNQCYAQPDVPGWTLQSGQVACEAAVLDGFSNEAFVYTYSFDGSYPLGISQKVAIAVVEHHFLTLYEFGEQQVASQLVAAQWAMHDQVQSVAVPIRLRAGMLAQMTAVYIVRCATAIVDPLECFDARFDEHDEPILTQSSNPDYPAMPTFARPSLGNMDSMPQLSVSVVSSRRVSDGGYRPTMMCVVWQEGSCVGFDYVSWTACDEITYQAIAAPQGTQPLVLRWDRRPGTGIDTLSTIILPENHLTKKVVTCGREQHEFTVSNRNASKMVRLDAGVGESDPYLDVQLDGPEEVQVGTTATYAARVIAAGMSGAGIGYYWQNSPGSSQRFESLVFEPGRQSYPYTPTIVGEVWVRVTARVTIPDVGERRATAMKMIRVVPTLSSGGGGPVEAN